MQPRSAQADAGNGPGPWTIDGLRGRWGRVRETRPEGSVWPDPRQELLLMAGLQPEEEAWQAWRAWSRAAGSRPLDGSSRQLLPMVYRNLCDQVARDPRLAALKDVYRLTWLRNQRLFHLLRATLERLHDAEVATLVFKGAALVPLYYPDAGARGMGDFDVLVPVEGFDRAVRVLESTGWQSLYWDPHRFDPRFEHAIPLLDPQGNSVDLHCHVLMASCGPETDRDVWEASIPLDVQGVPSRTLCPTDALLHACVHGVNWVENPQHRWVADAVLLTREAPGGIDWDRLVRFARARGLTPMVLPPLGYLRESFGIPVPPAVLRDLRESRVSPADRRRYELWTRRPRGRPVARLLHHWYMYTQGLGDVGWSRRMASLPEYLRFWAQTDRLSGIPARLVVKSVRVLGYRLGLYRYWDG